jgi:hypothetical protein
MVWFEDFERDNWLAKIMGGRRKFEKTEVSFSKAEVRAKRLVDRPSRHAHGRGGYITVLFLPPFLAR